jgi:hypothetical protein
MPMRASPVMLKPDVGASTGFGTTEAERGVPGPVQAARTKTPTRAAQIRIYSPRRSQNGPVLIPTLALG